MLKQTDIALERLKADLLAGVFNAGTRLWENALAQRYGMSRTPVREALSILAGQGWVIRSTGERRWVASDTHMHAATPAKAKIHCPACGSANHRLLTDAIGQVLWCQECFRVSPTAAEPKMENPRNR